MKSKPFRRAFGALLAAGAAAFLAPAPAQAAFVCWMSDGIRYCYDDGDRQVPAVPDPVPAEEPPAIPAPAPVEQIPAPAPAPVEQPVAQPVPVPDVPVQPVPVPVNPVPLPVPVPPRPVPAPPYAPAQSGGSYVPPVQAPAPIPAEVVAVPLPEAVPSAETAAAAAVPAVSPGPTAAASPPPSAFPAEGSGSQQASSTGDFNPLPMVLMTAAVLVAAALAWLVGPVRAVALRMVQAKR